SQENAAARAPLEQAALISDMQARLPLNLFSGEQMTGSGTMTGKDTQTKSPGLFNSVLAGGSILGSIFRKGAGAR
ncbi:hypothetical protein, partial [Pseudomonas sp. Fl4BN1]|uniref:hypothetical protein n=1 Tax=Pseudomonas sp. Fl4BN1 TaxID=2697651 RepID=UPI001C49B2D2